MATARLHRRHRRHRGPTRPGEHRRRGLDRHSGIVPWALSGLVLGLPAGALFILFEMFISGFSNPTLTGPLRIIGAIVLGQDALAPQPATGEPATGAGTVIIVGFIVHFVLAAVFGAIFGAILGGLSLGIGALSRSRAALTAAAAFGGLLLWLINFYVIAPAAFPWFTKLTMSSPIVQFFSHTIFYGAAFGLLLARRLSVTRV